MLKHKRQMSPTLSGIRHDHLRRYSFAVDWLRDNAPAIDSVIDMGCGCGYGSYILAKEGNLQVLSTEFDEGALAYAEEHYSHPLITHKNVDLRSFETIPKYHNTKAAVGFEIIEHLENGPDLLRYLKEKGIKVIIGSVPNEEVIPFDPKKHLWHVRHYTPLQLRNKLKSTGWNPIFIGGQRGKHGGEAEIKVNPTGCRTIVFVATS